MDRSICLWLAAAELIKAALTATGRKLLVTLNAMLAGQSDYVGIMPPDHSCRETRGGSIPT
jgi:hypothetical protein